MTVVIFADYGTTVAVWHKLLRERLTRSCDQVLLALGWRRVSGAGAKQQQDQRPRRRHLGESCPCPLAESCPK